MNARVNSKMNIVHMIPSPTHDPCAMLKFDLDRSTMVPFFDDKTDPHTIIIPFAKRMLFSLHSGEFFDQLYNYYYLTLQCIQTRPNERKEALDFKNKMVKWMNKEIVPLLKDKGKWYPGLWGALCVLGSLNQNCSKQIEMASILMENNKTTDCFYNLNNISFFYLLSLMLMVVIIIFVSVLSFAVNNNDNFWIFIGSLLCIQSDDVSDI